MTAECIDDRRSGSGRPLSGVTVLEIGNFVAAPFAIRLLGDLGAEIIKVEPPTGDPVRQWGAKVKGHNPWCSVHARNEECITLDLGRPDGRSVFLGLLRHCKALVENLRPGQLARMGLNEATLGEIKPGLVPARISGYGEDGPDWDRAACGVLGEALGGLRYLSNHPPGISDLPPVRVAASLGHSLAGLYVAFGVVAAPLRQARDGTAAKGVTVDVSIADSVFSLLEGALPEYGTLGTIHQSADGGIATAAPTTAYRPRDGVWVLIAADSDPLFKRLATVMSRRDLADDPRFLGSQARVHNVVALDTLVAEWTCRIDIDELDRLLEAADIPATRFYTIADCAADPQFLDRGMVREVQDPLFGRTLHPGVVPRIDTAYDPVNWTGPALSAHTESVLTGLLGYPSERPLALCEGGLT